MLTQLPSVPSLIPSSFATRAIGRDVSITIFTASSLNSGEKLFFGRGNYFTFPDVHPIGWTVRKLRGTPKSRSRYHVLISARPYSLAWGLVNAMGLRLFGRVGRLWVMVTLCDWWRFCGLVPAVPTGW